jgi:hypothetical protein
MERSRLEKLLEFLKNEPDDEFLQYALATEYLRLKPGRYGPELL